MAKTYTYRRKRSTSYQEWHYSDRCINWPSKDYELAYSEPMSGRICNECKRHEDKKKVVQW